MFPNKFLWMYNFESIQHFETEENWTKWTKIYHFLKLWKILFRWLSWSRKFKLEINDIFTNKQKTLLRKFRLLRNPIKLDLNFRDHFFGSLFYLDYCLFGPEFWTDLLLRLRFECNQEIKKKCFQSCFKCDKSWIEEGFFYLTPFKCAKRSLIKTNWQIFEWP